MVNRLVGVAAAAVVMAACLIGPAMAADTVGFVNIQEVFQGYDKTAKSNAELDNLSNQLILTLDTLKTHMLLSEAETKELVELVKKPTQTDKDKARLKELNDRQIALDKELGELASKKEPTADEQARLKELQNRQAAAGKYIEKTGEESQDQFEAKSKELSQQIRDDILKAIENVAKDKKLAVVIDKEAVLFGGTDITKAVLDKLNKK